MTQTEIGRIKMVAVAEENALPSLAEEAKELLGYSPREEDRSPQANMLQKVLAELEITVLDWRDVLKYQLERKYEMEQEALQALLVADAPPRWRSDPSWISRELSDFKGRIPAHVLQKALEIKRLLPEVEFVVEELSETPDPFLIARLKIGAYDYASYYIEVWDEPIFEKRL